MAKEKEFDRKTKKVFLSGLRGSGKSGEKGESSSSKTWVKIVVLVATVLMTCGVCFMLVFYYVDSKEVDPVSGMKAMTTLRAMPSNQEGLTVDELMTQELDKFKKSGNLKGYQGWHLKSIRGTESRVLVVFSFKDNEGNDHRAEWMVEVNNNIVVPQTELATAIYNK